MGSHAVTPHPLPRRSGGHASTPTTEQPIPIVVLDSDLPENVCVVDPGELATVDAIHTLSVHHRCPSPCRPRMRAMTAIATEYGPASTQDTHPQARPPDDHRLAEVIGEYLRVTTERADQ
uniref:hypothetical protein n=1 Tax=Nocardia noduli TaxID=2815722 RepID=UPI001C2210D5